jgi:hypothetical protein
MIVRWFFGSLIGLAGGLILLVGAGAVASAAGIFVMDGPDVVGIRSTGSAWLLVGLLGLAVLVLIGSGVAMFVAWIGAVLNTAYLPDKAWFILLLVVGLLGMVFLATIAYVAAGPDGLRPALPPGETLPDQRSGREPSARKTDEHHVGV